MTTQEKCRGPHRRGGDYDGGDADADPEQQAAPACLSAGSPRSPSAHRLVGRPGPATGLSRGRPAASARAAHPHDVGFILVGLPEHTWRCRGAAGSLIPANLPVVLVGQASATAVGRGARLPRRGSRRPGAQRGPGTGAQGRPGTGAQRSRLALGAPLQGVPGSLRRRKRLRRGAAGFRTTPWPAAGAGISTRIRTSAGRTIRPAPRPEPGIGTGPESGIGTRAEPGVGTGPEPGVLAGTGPRVRPGPEPRGWPRAEPGLTPGARLRTTPRVHATTTPRGQIRAATPARVGPRIQPGTTTRVQPRIRPRTTLRVHPGITTRVQPRITPRVQPRIWPGTAPRVRAGTAARVRIGVAPGIIAGVSARARTATVMTRPTALTIGTARGGRTPTGVPWILRTSVAHIPLSQSAAPFGCAARLRRNHSIMKHQPEARYLVGKARCWPAPGETAAAPGRNDPPMGHGRAQEGESGLEVAGRAGATSGRPQSLRG